MATIAFLTMVCLPGSFVAVSHFRQIGGREILTPAMVQSVFVMDPLGLQDDKKFKTPEKVWVLFAVAVPLIAAKFFVWYLWDRWGAIQEEMIATGGGQEEEGDGEDADGLILEPAVPGSEISMEALLLEMEAKKTQEIRIRRKGDCRWLGW